jgi:hemoglobin
VVRKLAKDFFYTVFTQSVYTGDSMLDVHAGMNINENHFNLMVDLLINAMDDANIPHNTQNKMLAKLATMRSDIIYK